MKDAGITQNTETRFRAWLLTAVMALLCLATASPAYAQRFRVIDVGKPRRGVEFTSPLTKSLSQIPPRLPDGDPLPTAQTLGGSMSVTLDRLPNGTSVGASYLMGDTAFHATVYDENGLHDLGTLGGDFSLARAINRSGTIVGESTVAGNVERHAFIYRKGRMWDINELIVTPNWVINEILRIEDDGRIIVSGRQAGGPRIAVLQPLDVGLPKPSAGAAGGVAIGVGAALLIKEIYIRPGRLRFRSEVPPDAPLSSGDTSSDIHPVKPFPPLSGPLPGAPTPPPPSGPGGGIVVTGPIIPPGGSGGTTGGGFIGGNTGGSTTGGGTVGGGTIGGGNSGGGTTGGTNGGDPGPSPVPEPGPFVVAAVFAGAILLRMGFQPRPNRKARKRRAGNPPPPR